MSHSVRRCITRNCLVVSVCLLGGTPALSQVVYDNGGPNILSAPTGNPAVALEVRDSATGDPTTLDAVAGAVIGGGSGRSVGVFGQSVYSMSGGSASGDLFVTDSAHAILSGGTFGDDAVVEANGQITVLPGGSIGDDFTARGNAHLEMSGGELPDEVFFEDSATATFTGGVVGDDLNPLDDSVVTLNDLTLEDSIDAFGSSTTYVNGGLINGSPSANESAKMYITGGAFPNVFGGGEQVAAVGTGARVEITGGTFGTAGASDDGGILATQGGIVTYSAALVPGVLDGTAPTAKFSAVLNGQVNVTNALFGGLALEAGNGGQLHLGEVGAEEIAVHVLGGGAVHIAGGHAETLDVFAELGGFVNLRGGQFDEIDVELIENSVLTVFGHSFIFLGTPVESLPAGAYVPATGELRTIGGELAGILADGSPFSMTYSRQFNPAPGARVFLVQVPEPTAVMLTLTTVVGLCILRRRGKSTR